MTIGGAWVAGVDGCPAGWLVVRHAISRPEHATAIIFARFADVLEVCADDVRIAIDIPIGLPDVTGLGGRACDVAARAPLGARQSSVFSVPSRAAVAEADYVRACEIAAATSNPPRRVSKQTFNLFPKIREVDALMTPELQARVVECHPELVFWRLNGKAAVPVAKKVRSKASPEGLAFRARLLTARGYDVARVLATPVKRSDAGADDVIDALANACAAADLVAGTAVRVPDVPPRDSRGLRMEIWG